MWCTYVYINRDHAHAEHRFKAVENDRLQDKGFLQHRTVVVGPITVYLYNIIYIILLCILCTSVLYIYIYIYIHIRVVGIIKYLLDVILLLCICTPYILVVTKYSSVYTLRYTYITYLCIHRAARYISDKRVVAARRLMMPLH